MAPFLRKAMEPSLMLYQHFRNRLEEEIEAFGRNRMSIEVAELRRQQRELEEECTAKEGRKTIVRCVEALTWKCKMHLTL